MGRAELKRLTIERFKSYSEPTSLEIAPLTILLGRNNSGKSTLIQALLLLKQTLDYPRSDVPLHLEGAVEAIHLRELTFGWPEDADFEGPTVKLTWESDVDVREALSADGRMPDLAYLKQHSGIDWIHPGPLPDSVRLRTTFDLRFGNRNESVLIRSIHLGSENIDSGETNPGIEILRGPQRDVVMWWSAPLEMGPGLEMHVEWDHFIPRITIDRSQMGPRDKQRTWYNGFKVLFEQPLEDLRRLLKGFHYLGSTRLEPPSIYRPATVPPQEVGMSGQYAAQMLHARKSDKVHFVPPLALDNGNLRLPEKVLCRPLPDAFNLVLHELGIHHDLDLHDIENVGFRILFGGASLHHVGRGIGYLLPAVLLGLVADPLRFQEPSEDLTLREYQNRCRTLTHAALEEPEIHLHPKVQTQLAHWLVALAMAGRRFIVETHSDHLVRRLRGLIARAPSGSELENWLEENVVVAEIEQAEDGRSQLTCSRLTETGGIEHWPADFMDEGAEEERSIYYAGLEKSDDSETYAAETEFIHDPVDE